MKRQAQIPPPKQLDHSLPRRSESGFAELTITMNALYFHLSILIPFSLHLINFKLKIYQYH